MKKIDIIYDLLETECGYYAVMEPAHKLFDIHEVFDISYEKPIRVLIGDMFGTGMDDVYYENADTDNKHPEEVRDLILRLDPSLNEDVTLEEWVDICLFLFEREISFFKTCHAFSQAGVELSVITKNPFNRELLEEWLGTEVFSPLTAYVNELATLEQVRKAFIVLLANQAQV